MRVGVIIPVLAPAPYLAEALESVLGQHPAPDVVVVVDDGSQPPLEVPEGVHLVRLEDGPRGPAAARAAGLAVLDTDLVALADADDVWEPGKLAAQLEALEEHPGAAVAVGRAVAVDAAGRPTSEQLPQLAAGLHTAQEMRGQLFDRNVVAAASVVAWRDALLAVGGFEGGPALPAGSDWELWLRLAAAGHAFVSVPHAVVRYRRHPNALTGEVALLGEAGLAIHAEHAALVDLPKARRARARDLLTLARGRVRQRRYAEAREALVEASELERPGMRERVLRVVLTVPGLRAALGRRKPYR
jgi:glycosyltransferase involved in cell wall biosynthesis